MTGAPSLSFLFPKIGSRIMASLAFALGILRAYSAEDPVGALERQTMEFEGIRIGFPKGEADVVEALKPALRAFVRERKRMAAEEADAFAKATSDPALGKKAGAIVAALMAREAPSGEFDARFKSSAADMRKFAGAWRKWSGGISELELWSRDELKPFQAREDEGEDAEGMTLKFPQVSFGKNGSHFALHPPFASPLLGLDSMRNVGKETAPLRLDFPLYYKPGESPQTIAKYDVKFLEEVPAVLRQQFTGMLTKGTSNWLFEYLLLGEIETLCVDVPTARDTALAEALAHTLLLTQLLALQGEAKTMAQSSLLFPFMPMGPDVPDTEAIIAMVEKMDPLAVVDRKRVTERIIARNLIALTIVKIAQAKGAGVLIFQKFKEAGIPIPQERFGIVTFTAAVDNAYGEKGLFRRMLAAQQKKAAAELRESAMEKMKAAKPAVPPPVATAPSAPPKRESAKYDGVTLTFPPELKGAMAILGPQCAKALAKARTFAAALPKQSPEAAALEVTDEDLAAYGRYGLEANAEIIRMFATIAPLVTDATAFLVRLFYGDSITVWFKEDLMALLKVGTEVPGFALDPDGKSVGWNFKLGVALNAEDFHRLALGGKDITAELSKRISTIPPPVLPMVVKRADLAGKLEDPQTTAETIRQKEGAILGLLLRAEKEPLKENDFAGLSRPLMSLEQVWFLVAHETAENAIVSGTIASADRRWYCDGMANWIAIREVDRRFGKGKGAEAFAKNYDAEELRTHAGEVNLLAWPTEEDIKSGSRPQVGNVVAHYYFATLVIEKGCEGQGGDFVKRWLEEIRRTPLNRTNSGTILAAYQKLTGKDLAAIIAEIVK